MDPVTLLPFVIEAAEQLVASRASHRFRSRSRVRRVARKSAQDAANEGLIVTARGLRGWLRREDTIRLLEAHTAASIEEAARSLSVVVAGADDASRVEAAHQVLAITLRNYVSDLEPAAAVHLATRWSEVVAREEGVATRSLIQAEVGTITLRLDKRSSFAEHLLTLPPLVKERATAIQATWSGIERLIADLVAADSRREAIRQWAATPPDWLVGAPPTAQALLGSLAASYDEAQAAAEYYLQATRAGGTPRGYLIARAAFCFESADDRAKALELLRDTSENHPYAAALLATLEDRLNDASQVLETWAPTAPDQHVEREMLAAALERACGQTSRAIAIYEAVSSEFGTAGGFIGAAELLLARGALRQTATRLADSRRAFELAIRARDSRRTWGGDSIRPTELAVVASVLTGDPERAWRLTRPAPEGEATEAEAGARAIVEHAAMTAALTDRLESARELLGSVTDQYARLSVIAVLAERGEIVDPTCPGPEAAWRAAYAAANSDSERLQSARGLADHGVRAEGLDDLAAAYPQAVDEIRAISAAMAPGDDQLVRLRAGANTSPGIAVRLAELYAEGDRPEESAAVLHDAGERWGSPQLLAMAAEQYRRAGLPAEALESVHQALSTSSQEWHGRRACQALLVELYSEAEEWPRAVEAARALLESRPDDGDANWALVRCLHAQRDFEQAWHALTRDGEPRAPRSNVEALVWLDICRRHAPPTQFYGLMLATLDEWKHDERVYAAFVQTFLMSPAESAPSPEEAQRIQAAIADFTRTFPESDYLKAITVDEENPLASFPRELLEHDKAVDEIHERVRSGALPIGAFATAVGRTFTEASLHRVAGAVYAHRRDEPGTAAETISLAKMVVIDPTAIHTLALVSDSLAAFALGSVPSVTTTTSLFDDALLARESLAQRSTLSVEWDPDDQRPALRGISDEQAERLADLSSRVVALMSRIRRLPRRELRHFGDLKKLKDAGWLTALDLAKDRGCPYWTDDLILRDLARSMGVEAVGSLRIFELCTLLPGGPSREQLAVESATLLSNYYVDLPFSDEVWRLSATADGWRPSGAAFALTRPPAWQDPASASAFLLEAIDHVRDEDPSALRGWVASGALGLGRVAGNKDAASENLQILGRTLLSKPWVGPHQVPFLAEGIRAAATELGLEDPLPPIVSKYYQDVLGAANSHALAAAYMRMLFSQSDEATQRLAARVVILAPLDEGR